MENEDRLAYVDRVLGGSGRQEALTAASGRKNCARPSTPNGLTDGCSDPDLIGLGLLVTNPSAEFRNGCLRQGIGRSEDWPHWSKV